jgi:hypothetical protein
MLCFIKALWLAMRVLCGAHGFGYIHATVFVLETIICNWIVQPARAGDQQQFPKLVRDVMLWYGSRTPWFRCRPSLQGI